jgi:hypothetical protein
LKDLGSEFIIKTGLPKVDEAFGEFLAQGQRISISLNSQYFGEELIVETAPNHLAS